jgi:Tfp pilus tip-associated adhesin PilY1
MAQLTDPSGKQQAVTTPPEAEVDIINGVDRWIFIGTGRLLSPSDLTEPAIADQQQTFYAIRDGTTTTPNPIDPAKPLTRADLTPLIDKVGGLTARPDKGWYDDLPDTLDGQRRRIITPVKAALSLVAYAGTSPQDNPCLTGEPSTLYVRTFSVGESLLQDAGGVRVEGVDMQQGAVGLDITIFTDSSDDKTAGGIDIRIAITGANSTLVFKQVIPPPELGAHRMSWRLLGQ